MPRPTHADVDQLFDDYINALVNLETEFFDSLEQDSGLPANEIQMLRILFNAQRNLSRDPANIMRVFWKQFVPDTP